MKDEKVAEAETQAERQTKTLESIDTTLKWLFGLVLLFAAAWLIVVVNHV